MEEAFSKDLLVRQKKKDGPIFSLRDEFGENFKYFFEVYSKDYWLQKDPKLINDLFVILNNVRDKNFHTNEYFDTDKWAKYFAIMDLTGAYHGSVLDSVKLYFNPQTLRFEPIGYDLHKGAGIFDNFIISDLLDDRKNQIVVGYVNIKIFSLFFLN